METFRTTWSFHWKFAGYFVSSCQCSLSDCKSRELIDSLISCSTWSLKRASAGSRVCAKAGRGSAASNATTRRMIRVRSMAYNTAPEVPITHRSREGSARRCLLASLMIPLAALRVAAAGQDAAAMPLVGPIAQTVVPEADAAQGTREQPPPEGVTAREPRKKRDKLKLHWRSASIDYGKKFRIDFRSRLRGEVRASDAAVTKEVLDELDIPRRRVGFDGRILQAAAFKV